MTASAATGEGRRAASQARNSKTLERGVRVGLVAYGVVHLLIGWTALQLAWGSGGGSADQSGAMRELAQQPLGTAMLWLVAVGLLALVVWQAVEAAIGHQREDGAKRVAKRVGSAGKAVVYAVLAVSAVRYATGSAGGGGSSEESMTAQLMSAPAGQVLVAAVGLSIIGVGGYLVVKGVTKRFTKDLAGASRGAIRLGQAGYAAKGVSLAVVGALFTYAGATHDASQAGGLDEALRTLLQQSYGQVLLTAVALGIVAFGIYCFAWARHPATKG